MANQNSKAVVFSAEKDYEYKIQKKRIFKEDYAPFCMIGPLNSGDGSMDIFDRLASLSKGAFKVFIEIKNKRSDINNLATLTRLESLTENQMKVFRRHIAELNKMDLVVHVKNISDTKMGKHTYMINPEYLKCKDYSVAKELWKFFNQKGSIHVDQILHLILKYK